MKMLNFILMEVWETKNSTLFRIKKKTEIVVDKLSKEISNYVIKYIKKQNNCCVWTKHKEKAILLIH